jgi:hypothetical protein
MSSPIWPSGQGEVITAPKAPYSPIGLSAEAGHRTIPRKQKLQHGALRAVDLESAREKGQNAPRMT